MNIKLIFLFSSIFALFSCSSVDNNKKMIVNKVSEIQNFDDSSPVFTGNVKVQMLFGPERVSPITGAYVTFSRGARSAWHTHPNGQRLVVTKGEGVVQQWGEKAVLIKKGDVIWTPPGVKHWHGACLDEEMTHTALQEIKNGTNVKWMEKVTDEQYSEALKSLNK